MQKAEGHPSATWRKRLCDVSNLSIPRPPWVHAPELLRRQPDAGEREDAAGLFAEAPGGDVGSAVFRTQTADERACRGRAHGHLRCLVLKRVIVSVRKRVVPSLRSFRQSYSIDR